jgi:dCMP deaminase
MAGSVSEDQYMKVADAAMHLSEDSHSPVGAFLLCPDGRAFVGWNRVLPNLIMSDERWQRPMKYNCIITAEASAIAAGERYTLEGATLYLTCLPSTLDVKRIACSGIRRVVCRPSMNSDIVQKTAAEARQILEDVGITVQEI